MGTHGLCLVTGGAGFIGSNLVVALLERGHRVRVVDNLVTGRLSNLEGLLSGVEFVQADLADESAAKRVMEGVAIVWHQAALPSVPRSIADPLISNRANVTATLNVLTAARDAGVRRVIYASSSSAYGNTPVLPKVETMTPAPLSPYAVSKLTGEYYCRAFSHVYGITTVSLRYFNVFGPRQDPNSQYSAVIPKFISSYLRGEAPTIDGDGEQSRGFTYIDNVVSANLLAAEAEGISGEVLNISVDSQMSLNAMDAKLREFTGVGSSILPNHGPDRPGDIKHSYADIEKAEKLLGYKVLVSTEEGLRKTVEWYRQRM